MCVSARDGHRQREREREREGETVDGDGQRERERFRLVRAFRSIVKVLEALLHSFYKGLVQAIQGFYGSAASVFGAVGFILEGFGFRA